MKVIFFVDSLKKCVYTNSINPTRQNYNIENFNIEIRRNKLYTVGMNEAKDY